MKKRLLATLISLGCIWPIAASAQTTPSYATADQDEQIRGRVVSFNGGYDLTVRDGKGYIDNVELHEGTIINPTGLTLEPGMVVSILGYNAGSYFSANEIDTPYTYYDDVPYYEGHPWSYFGAGVGLGFFFGNMGWWHGSAFTGGYHYVGGARVYNHVNFHNIYGGHAGGFHGHDFVAPHVAGGYHAPSAGGHFGGGHFAGGHVGGAHFGGGGHFGGGHFGGGHPPR